MIASYEKLGRYRVHHIDFEGNLWVSQGYNVFVTKDYGKSFKFRAKYNPSILMSMTKSSRLAWRFVRGGFHDLVVLNDHSLVASVRGRILRCAPDSDKFVETFRTIGRTFKFGITPQNTIFTGEYFHNDLHMPVHVLGSNDCGLNWQKVYTFKAGEIRHVHCIKYDPYRKGLVVLTGDRSNESKILFTKDEFITVSLLTKGSQSSRAYAIIPVNDGYYFPTDTQYEQNYVQFLDTSGIIHSLFPINNSGMAACKVNKYLFFGTQAEPSNVNLDPMPTLYGSSNGIEWEVIDRWFADYWSRGFRLKTFFFKMACVTFPSGENKSNHLFATTTAVKNNDQTLHHWILR